MLNKILCVGRKEGFWGLDRKKKKKTRNGKSSLMPLLSINFFLRRAWPRLFLERRALVDTVQLHPPLSK